MLKTVDETPEEEGTLQRNLHEAINYAIDEEDNVGVVFALVGLTQAVLLLGDRICKRLQSLDETIWKAGQ